MPKLLRLRFVSVGHPQARLDDLVLDFRGPDGDATDSTLWLRNGGGKSSILNLFFAIVRPHRAEFLGGKAEAKQRSLNDYILHGDRAITAAEWRLDPAADFFAPERERFITGVFYERRDGGDLRRLFFSCRVDPDHPETTLDGLPIYSQNDGSRSRRTFSAFREAWRSLRDHAPQAGIADTENQREWQEILEAARIDPELFSYQVRMNQREGGADELFRFAEAEDFVDFLLALALDPTLGNRVGRNIGAFRHELLQRKEQLVPERDLVERLLTPMQAISGVSVRRQRLRQELGEMRQDIAALISSAARRQAELEQEQRSAKAEGAARSAVAVENDQKALGHRARAAHLKLHAAELTLRRLEDEDRQVQEEWKSAQRLVKIWTAAVPLRAAIKFEDTAREQRRTVEERTRQYAPLRAELVHAAMRYAGALTWRAQQHRTKEKSARAAEANERREAQEARTQAVDAGKSQTRAESRAAELQSRLEAAETKRLQLVSQKVLEADEAPDVGLARWNTDAKDCEDAISHIDGEIERVDVALESLQRAIAGARNVLNVCRERVVSQQSELRTATLEREPLEADVILRSALELESIDADRLGAEAVTTLDQAARAAQKVVIDTRGAAADDERALLHLETQGLLPPSTDVQRILAFLSGRLGGQAWSGWSWIAANVPKDKARDAVRKAPSVAQGVVVRPSDFNRAAELLAEAGVEPDAPLLLADTGAVENSAELPGKVIGPRETAWFDRDAGRSRTVELKTRVEEYSRRITEAERQSRELTACCERVRAFRTKYSIGWFAETERTLSDAKLREEEASRQLAELEQDRQRKTNERKGLETQRREKEKGTREARQARDRLESFVEDHFLPSAGWRAQHERAKDDAKRCADEVDEWNRIALSADDRATAASLEGLNEAESARAYEVELANVAYIDGDLAVQPGALDELRDRYRMLRDQYEEKLGAETFLALAGQNDQSARDERARLRRHLTAEVDEEIVRKYLMELPEPDTVEQQREDAEDKNKSLFSRVGTIGAQIGPAKTSRNQASEACKNFSGIGLPERFPSTPELAEGEAAIAEERAEEYEGVAASARADAESAEERAGHAAERAEFIRRHVDRLRDLQNAYSDLLATGADPLATVPTALEEATVGRQIETLSGQLKHGRSIWQEMDAERATASKSLRAAIGASGQSRLEASWVGRLQEHDDRALEDHSTRLCDQLETRRSVLNDQIANVERHRTVLLDELNAVADEGLKLLAQATTLSRLPDDIPGIGGAQFLRIQTDVPDDPVERRARLAELIDELITGERDLDGISLVQGAVRRLARPIEVRVLHPDPALDRKTVSIPEMARASGGEQLTGAILLYCTLARVRARSRGPARRGSGILILDNPIGRASRVRFLELQRDVARAMGIQLIYTTGVNDHEALRALPNVLRLRNERVDRNSGRRLLEHVAGELGTLESVHIGRREEHAIAAE